MAYHTTKDVALKTKATLDEVREYIRTNYKKDKDYSYRGKEIYVDTYIALEVKYHFSCRK